MGKLRGFVAFLVRYERYLFVLAVLLLLHEVFATAWIASEDGPAHLYNSVVVRELWFHPESPLHKIFQLNHSLVPNCLGHFILSFLTSFCSFENSEKILHALIVVGYCFSFRFLANQIHSGNSFYSWLVFPFVYSNTFFLGFENFLLGIVFFLLTTGIWFWSEKKSRKIGPMILLFVSSTLLFLSHLVLFLLFLLIVGTRIILYLFRKEYKTFFTKSGFLFLAVFPALILLIKYLLGRTEVGGVDWMKSSSAFSYLISLAHIYLHEGSQVSWAIFLSIFLFLLLFISIILFFKKRKTQSADENSRFIFWGCWWMILVILVFATPDSFGGGGLFTVRMIEISWIFFLLFLVSGKLPNGVLILAAAVSLYVGMTMTDIRSVKAGNLQGYFKQATNLSPYIAENSTAVYISVATNWPMLHVGELAFAAKKTALLSNYESGHDYFPLIWQKEFPYNYTIGGLTSADLYCADCWWPAEQDKPEKQIDYVLICKQDVRDSACYTRLIDTLQKYYVLKKDDPPFALYESNASLKVIVQ